MSLSLMTRSSLGFTSKFTSISSSSTNPSLSRDMFLKDNVSSSAGLPADSLTSSEVSIPLGTSIID